MDIDYQAQGGGKEAPDREECVGIECVCDEKGEEHGSSKDVDLEGTGEHSSGTCGDKIEREAQERVGHVYLVGNTLLYYTGSYWSYENPDKKIETHKRSEERYASKKFFSRRVLFHEPYRSGNKHRPEYVRKHYKHIRRDRMKCWRAEREPYYTLDNLLDPKKQRNSCKGER